MKDQHGHRVCVRVTVFVSCRHFVGGRKERLDLKTSRTTPTDHV